MHRLVGEIPSLVHALLPLTNPSTQAGASIIAGSSTLHPSQLLAVSYQESAVSRSTISKASADDLYSNS